MSPSIEMEHRKKKGQAVEKSPLPAVSAALGRQNGDAVADLAHL